MHPACSGDCTYLTCLGDVLTVMDAVSSPRLQLAFDAYHFGADPTALELLPQFSGRIAIVHLADGKSPVDHEQNRTRLGDGIVPLADVMATLTAAGYDGDYDVELIGQEI